MSYILVRQESPVLIIGQAPAQRDDPSSPLSGRSGRKLAGLMDMNLPEFLETFDRANLFNKWTGKSGKGDKWDATQAARNAHLLVRNNPILEYRAILLLGKNVAKALGFPTDEVLKWQTTHRPFVAILPHPSGVNFWWNDNRNQRAAKDFLNEMADRYFGETYTRF